MELSKIISSSLKYPFRNIAKLPIIFILFLLIAVIPIGRLLDNNYIVLVGVIAFFIFLLIVPGYFLGVVRKGSIESSLFPSLSLVDSIYDSIRVLVLRMVYMIVPTIVFFIAFSTLGASAADMLYGWQISNFLATLGAMLLLILIVYLIFEFLLLFAKARLAYLNSLKEALKINKVMGDIKKIGIVNIIKWIILMIILLVAVSLISSLVMAIPYVGFLIYVAVVIPIAESIGNYSLGLLYSNIIDNDNDLDKLEQEIKQFKYHN
ncbi:MAG: DUF4013 domain-containing protein [Methanobrevibacter sp.]|nr:DUF4013 domain-containing protein [Methanobrevibacter sp.]